MNDEKDYLVSFRDASKWARKRERDAYFMAAITSASLGLILVLCATVILYYFM
jgi:hypothetical protein